MANQINNLQELAKWAHIQNSGGIEYLWTIYATQSKYELMRDLPVPPNTPVTEVPYYSESVYLDMEFAKDLPRSGVVTASQIVGYFDEVLAFQMRNEYVEKRKRMERNYLKKRIEKFKNEFDEEL